MANEQPSCEDIRESGALPVSQALDKILRGIFAIEEYEQIDISAALGRTLHENIRAPFDVPGLANAAVDGYAILSSDIPDQGERELEIVGRVCAGERFQGRLHNGQCVRITTGAPIPDGADSVMMQEHVVVADRRIRIDHHQRPGQNIRQAGEDLGRGETVLHIGRWLTPADIGLLASIGIAEVRVRRKLRIAVASTGNELRQVGTPLSEGSRYDSNRYSLMAALSRPDIEVIDIGVLADDPGKLAQCFGKAAAYADMIIASGGVSAGDADFTKTALRASGRIDFWKIAVKPGRPLAFGSLGRTVFFGLPGNPVAVLVAFYLFVLPAIDKLLGTRDKPVAPPFNAVSAEPIRKKPGRTEVLRGVLERTATGSWQVRTTGNQGSGILRSMSLANAFIVLEHDRGEIKAGETLTVLPFAGLMG